MDAIEAAQVLSEIGYLLRQDPKERFRAKAFSAAAWSLALQRPNLVDLQRAENLTSIEGVGEGIARVLTDVIQTGQSRYLNRLREQFKPTYENRAHYDELVKDGWALSVYRPVILEDAAKVTF